MPVKMPSVVWKRAALSYQFMPKSAFWDSFPV
jgi:hypothetical protein